MERELVDLAGVAVPDNLRFCAVDLEMTALPAILAAADLDGRAPACFSWLGTIQYLTERAIRSTLEWIGSWPRGTGLVLSFVVPDGLLDPDEAAGIQAWAGVAAANGEPWTTRVGPDDLGRWLRAAGFSSIHALTPEAAGARYLGGRRDGLAMPRWMGLMRATL